MPQLFIKSLIISLCRRYISRQLSLKHVRWSQSAFVTPEMAYALSAATSLWTFQDVTAQWSPQSKSNHLRHYWTFLAHLGDVNTWFEKLRTLRCLRNQSFNSLDSPSSSVFIVISSIYGFWFHNKKVQILALCVFLFTLLTFELVV